MVFSRTICASMFGTNCAIRCRGIGLLDRALPSLIDDQWGQVTRALVSREHPLRPVGAATPVSKVAKRQCFGSTVRPRSPVEQFEAAW